MEERRKLKHFPRLFTESELKKVEGSAPFFGGRHPIWYPLFGPERVATDWCLDQAVASIEREREGGQWLKSQLPRLLDMQEPRNASGAMAEIRVYGALLECELDVRPEQSGEAPTPDFVIRAGGHSTVVEVAARHEARKASEFRQAISDHLRAGGVGLPPGVERHVWHMESGRNIEIVESSHHPGGSPDPSKPLDGVQANLISRVCAVKGCARQLGSGVAGILVIDLTIFGERSEGDMLLSDQVSPMLSCRPGVISGAIWYAMYGWKGAPVFEAGSVVPMQHEGRFRQDDGSRLSAALVVLGESATLLENPWAANRLGDEVRLGILRYPWFDLRHSICDWQRGDAKGQVEIQEGMIRVCDQNRDDMWWEA